MIEEFGATYEEVRNRLLTRNRKGEDLPCSSQILEEISWLMLYTARRNDLTKRFGDLEESLKIADQSFAFKQSEQDGAWGVCHEEWLLR